VANTNLQKHIYTTINNSADVNATNNLGVTLLHLACQRGNKNIVEILINKGANVNTQNSAGLTALDLAEKNSHIEIVELLREHGAEE